MQPCSLPVRRSTALCRFADLRHHADMHRQEMDEHGGHQA
jgi:hypothetical protein